MACISHTRISHLSRRLNLTIHPRATLHRNNHGNFRKPRLEQLENRSLLATITVTTAVDELTPSNGSVSLREAIASINAQNTSGDADIAAQNPGVFGANDTIRFSIAGTGVQTIRVGVDPSAFHTPLPPITVPLMIDGYTQPGASPNTLANGDNAILRIVLDGRQGGLIDGLVVSGGNTTIRGLVIGGFQRGLNDAIVYVGAEASFWPATTMSLQATSSASLRTASPASRIAIWEFVSRAAVIVSAEQRPPIAM